MVNATLNLITTWTIQNPDNSSTVYNRLQITESPAGGTSRVWLYSYNSTTSTWTLSHPGGTVEHRLKRTKDLSSGNTIETIDLAEPSGPVLLEQSRVLTNLSWGLGTVVEGSGAGTETQNVQYLLATNSTVPGAANSFSWQTVTTGDGKWRYVVGFDGLGRATNVLSGIDPGATSNPSTCLSTVYSFTPVASGDDGSVAPNSPRMELVCFKGTPIRRSYHVYQPGEQWDIACLSPGAAYNDTSNLKTISLSFTNGVFMGRVFRISKPNGTIDTYSYSDTTTNKMVTLDTGEPDSTGTNVLNGFRSVDVTGQFGEDISHVRRVIVNGTPGIVLEQDIYSNFDTFRRPQRVTHLDGTSELTTYSCCGIDTTTDRDGVVTQYVYDSLKREVATIRLGITTTNVLDAAGRVLQQYRIGTNGSSILLSQTAYDTAGNLTNQINGLSGVTRYSSGFDVNGYLTKTTTYPDGGTRIESFYADGRMKKLTGSAVGPLRYTYGVEATSDTETGSNTYFYEQVVKLDLSGSDTSEWIKTYTDALGRVVKVVYSDGAYSLSLYNSKGQLSKTIDPDKVVALFQYNALGELVVQAIDTDQNGIIDLGGTDRITQSTKTYLASGDSGNTRGYDLVRVTTSTYAATNSSSSSLVQISENSTDRLRSWATVFQDQSNPLTQSQTTLYGTNGLRTVTAIATDGSQTVATYQNGLIVTMLRMDSVAGQISSTSYQYDAHGRSLAVVDARNGAETYGYNSADLVSSKTSPRADAIQPAQTTLIGYDSSLRPTSMTYPDGNVTTTEYYASGLTKRTFGARSYPVGYGYDAQGRLTSMTNWSSFSSAGGARVTAWVYDAYRGRMTGKLYQDGSGPSYSYTPGGRLNSRTWARAKAGGGNIVTTFRYGFNESGSVIKTADMTSVSYNDGTPGMTFAYDRRGRRIGSVRNGITTARTLNDLGQLLSESYTGATLSSFSVNSTYDSLARRTNFNFKTGTSIYAKSIYGYDNASRLQSVGDGTYSANYVYEANSSLSGQIVFKNGSSTKLTTVRTYDFLGRLKGAVSTPSVSGQSTISYGYQYNQANERALLTLGDKSYWRYQYDALGQVVSGKRYWSEGVSIPGQQFEYTFDDIGNRVTTKSGGDASGGDLRTSTYTANLLNQYSARTAPNALDVLGLSDPGATVTINGSAPDYRHGEYFQEKVTVANSTTPVWQGVTVTAGGTSVIGNIFVPSATETNTFDLDGNLTGDAHWSYSWDAENRLVTMISKIANGPQRLDFEYDVEGRRIRKKVWPTTAGSGTTVSDTKYLYDGWNIVGEMDGKNSNALVRSYRWGIDLSGSESSAGGVGGLLTAKSAGGNLQFVVSDGNGNVAALVDGVSSSVSAIYEYGPFGELVGSNGSTAQACPFRFSTRYQDEESDLIYYGYRFYSSTSGRWLSRDPNGEGGGINLSGFIGNDSINRWDRLGLEPGTVDSGMKDFAIWRIQNWVNVIERGSLVTDTGVLEYANNLIDTAGKLSYRRQVLKKDASAQYIPGERVMLFWPSGDPSEGDVLHEMTHAWNDITIKLNRYTDDRDDEGSAYAFEKFAGVLERLRDLDRVLDGPGCDRRNVKSLWVGMWDKFGNFPGSWGGGQSGVWVTTNFDVNRGDVQNLMKWAGLKMNCPSLAAIVNAKLEQHNCCFRVRCSKSDAVSKFDIWPTIPIDKIFNTPKK